MPIQIQFGIFGDDQVVRSIERIGRHADDLSPAFHSVFNRLREINAEQFLSQGQRGSGGWDPLNPDYVQWKVRHGLDPDILFATHKLFNAMAGHTDPNQEVIIEPSWAVFRIIGEPGDYGPVHQHGTDDGTIPARPPFALTEADRVAFIKEIQRWVITGELGRFLDI